MPEIEYERALDDTAQEWMRTRISTAGGSVIGFVVQYETTIDGRRVPAVRDDDHHGFAHKDVLNRRGEVAQKSRIDDVPLGNVATAASRNIFDNWPAYRIEFLGDEA